MIFHQRLSAHESPSTCKACLGRENEITSDTRRMWSVAKAVPPMNAANCAVQVKVTQSTEAHHLPQIINTLQKGDYFGEKALIR